MFGLQTIARLNDEQVTRERNIAKLRAKKRLPAVATNRYAKQAKGGCIKLVPTYCDEFVLRINRQGVVTKVA